ncbi:MAG: restriction endonuclease subunit S [Candidatus Methylomirabilia bacterium]
MSATATSPRRETWRAVRLKFFTFRLYGLSQPPDYQTEGIAFVRATNVARGKFSKEGLVFVSEDVLSEHRTIKLKTGDIIVVRSGAYTGDSAIVTADWAGGIAGFDIVMRVTRYADPQFVAYSLLSPTVLHRQIEPMSSRAAQPHLNAEELGDVELMLPTLDEQRAIADYLDRETARLDALVAAKERVLGLLAEKRRALITRAVTRGLDPHASLRDSGSPWLGEIPAHWGTSKFTWSVFIVEGQVDPEVEPYVSMPLIAPNHVESGTGRLLSQETAADQGAISGKYLCRRDDVIYSKIRPALRKATIAVEECLCSADMYPLRARAGIQPEFLLLFLLSEPFSTWAVLESNRVAMPKINREALSEIRIPVPPSEEQRQIVAHTKDATARLDAMRSATERTIVLLKERRAALIAAAVTGQIDVGAKCA